MRKRQGSDFVSNFDFKLRNPFLSTEFTINNYRIETDSKIDESSTKSMLRMKIRQTMPLKN